jgi:spore cortex formation protein SpoVR/YcgB (stage V sporulation)
MSDTPPSTDSEEFVALLEQQVAETEYINLADQERLRKLLRSTDERAKQIRDRVIALLNPAGLPVMALTDKDLENDYSVVAQDNYRLNCGIDKWGIFDATHGQYVVVNIYPL